TLDNPRPKLRQQLMQRRQTAAGYVQMLQRASLMTEGPRLCGNDWIFQQDNTTVHNACRTRDFFQKNSITFLDHPAYFPDPNPIENLWG
uniref:Tc1-like transposase DDE domain-containing protein n=2 Tax=Haplochromini TaxID=319058 RepID=A0A3B4EU37_9CICH